MGRKRKKREKRNKGKKKEKKRKENPPPHTHTQKNTGPAQLVVFIRGTDIACHVHEQLASLRAFQTVAPAFNEHTHSFVFGTGPEELPFDGVSSTRSCTAAF